MDDPQEPTGDGGRVYRHEARTALTQMPALPGLHMATIEAHIGQPDLVYHKPLSDRVHLA